MSEFAGYRVYGYDLGKPGGDRTCVMEGRVDESGRVVVESIAFLPQARAVIVNMPPPHKMSDAVPAPWPWSLADMWGA